MRNILLIVSSRCTIPFYNRLPVLLILLKGFLLGLGAAAPIGPVNVEIARRTIRHGFLAGFLVGCGAVTIDIAYAIASSFGLRYLLDIPHLTQTLGIVGGSILLYLGIVSLRAAWNQADALTPDAPSRPTSRRAYLTGLVMTATNPMTLAFWLIVVPGIAGQTATDPTSQLPLLCLGVFLGAFGWVCGFTALIHRVTRHARARTARITDLAGGGILITFAVLAWFRVISQWIA